MEPRVLHDVSTHRERSMRVWHFRAPLFVCSSNGRGRRNCMCPIRKGVIIIAVRKIKRERHGSKWIRGLLMAEGAIRIGSVVSTGSVVVSSRQSQRSQCVGYDNYKYLSPRLHESIKVMITSSSLSHHIKCPYPASHLTPVISFSLVAISHQSYPEVIGTQEEAYKLSMFQSSNRPHRVSYLLTFLG